MPDITSELNAFKSAIHGEDVRDGLISAIRKMNTVVDTQQATDAQFRADESAARTAFQSAQTQRQSTFESNLTGRQTAYETNLSGDYNQFKQDVLAVTGSIEDLASDLNATKGTLCEEITNIAVKKTATGSFIHLDDSAEYPISEIVIYGKSTQAGTPSVENPVPIESVSSGVLVAGNKNLFNADDLPNQSWAQNLIGASGGQAWNVVFMGEAALSKFLKPNTTYTISYDVECISVPDYDTTSGDAYGFSLARSDGSGTELSFGRRYEFLTAGQKVHISKTLTTSDDVSGLVMKIYTNRYLKDGSGVFSRMSFTNLQIEEASTATDYEESKRETAEIPFTLRGIKTSRSEIGTHTDANGQMWIADELRIRADGTGKLIQRIGAASTETLASKNWSVYGTHTYQLFGATGFNDRNKRVAFINTVMSNVLSVTPNGQSIFSYADTAAGNIGFNGGDSSYHILHMTIPDQSITTNEQVRQWIRDHGLEVIYGIEPIETELTAQQVKALLLKTFYPVSNIYNDKNADMEVTYAVDTKTCIDNKFAVLEALIGDESAARTAFQSAQTQRQDAFEQDVLAVTGSISDLTTDLAATKADLNATKETFLADTISNLFMTQRTGKIYSVKVWKSDVNPTQVCEKLDDNAGLVMEPSSATVEGRDDYADIPLFKWWHCNYEVDSVGFRKPTHIAGSAFYSESGSAEVGSLFMTPYYRIQDFDEYQIISISDTKHDGFTTPAGAFDEEGVEHPYMIVPAYMMVQADDGYLRSQPDKPVKVSLSHMTINQAIKAKTPDGDGGQAWMMWLVMMMIMIKTGKKSSQATFPGCTDANYQYPAAEIYADARSYFPLTPSQASRFFVGAPIAVGYEDTSSTSPKDRSRTTMSSYGIGRVTAIESLSSSVAAVYVDTPPFATSDVGEAKVYLSFWPWYTGSTRGVKGHHDGALVNDVKHPFRVHGIELGLGCYEIPSDLAVTINAQNGRILYRRPMGMTAVNNQAQIESDYELVGEIPDLNGGSDYYIGDCDMSNEVGTPASSTSSSAYGIGDRLYWGDSATSGCREWFRLGYLGIGSVAGLGFVALWNSLTSAIWSCGGRG